MDYIQYFNISSFFDLEGQHAICRKKTSVKCILLILANILVLPENWGYVRQIYGIQNVYLMQLSSL
jgi:hypothetical protein